MLNANLLKTASTIYLYPRGNGMESYESHATQRLVELDVEGILGD